MNRKVKTSKASLRNLLTEEEFFRKYKIDKYPHPSVTADVVAFSIKDVPTGNYRRPYESRMCVLLIRRGAHPFKGMWALPGGFFKPGETIESCAARELSEETGLKGQVLLPIATFSKPGRDPRGWIISCAFLAVVAKGEGMEVKGGDDARSAHWVPVDDVKSGKVEMAFDHLEIFQAAMRRLRLGDVTQMAFRFLPRAFTLSELQAVHEFIEERALLGPNFRRKMKPLLEALEMEGSQAGAGHRPAGLFKVKEN